MEVGKVAEHLCLTLISLYEEKKFNNDKWIRDMVVGKVAVPLCLNTNYQRIEI